MIRKYDLTGMRFTKLVVLDYEKVSKDRVACKCLCDCGNIKYVMPGNLKNGSTRSCGCIKIKHQDTGKKLHNIWIGMRRRCRNKDEPRYGGRGISVIPLWDDYLVFKKWALDNGYVEGLSLDRINNDGDYCPENCRWLTREDNSARVINGFKERIQQLELENKMLKEALYGKHGKHTTLIDTAKARYKDV